MEGDIILYDWLSFTLKWDSPRIVADMLGLGDLPWEITKGARGYKDRLYFNAISIHFNGRPDMGVWCEMSGQGCRAFESLTQLPGKWEDLFTRINESGANITRLDVAYDDHSGLLDIDELIQDTRKKEYVSKSDYWEILESSKGQTLQFGSPQSDVLIRIYDKAAEKHCAPGEHWIRCELQLRRERAITFTQLGLPIGESYYGVVVNYLRFVDPLEGDSNRWRWPIKAYWDNFLNSAKAISIYVTPGIEYNFDRCQRYVINQAGNAIDAYIQITGVEGFLQDLKARTIQRNPKYDRLVREFREYNLGEN